MLLLNEIIFRKKGLKCYILAEENVSGRSVISLTDGLQLQEYVDFPTFSKYLRVKNTYLVD